MGMCSTYGNFQWGNDETNHWMSGRFPCLVISNVPSDNLNHPHLAHWNRWPPSACPQTWVWGGFIRNIDQFPGMNRPQKLDPSVCLKRTGETPAGHFPQVLSQGHPVEASKIHEKTKTLSPLNPPNLINWSHLKVSTSCPICKTVPWLQRGSSRSHRCLNREACKTGKMAKQQLGRQKPADQQEIQPFGCVKK